MMLSIIDIGVTAAGFLGGIVSASLKRGHEFKLAALKANKEDLKAARANNNEWISWTRRFIAIAATLFIFGAPILAMLLDYNVYVAYTETVGFIPSWLFGETDFRWEHLPAGLVMTPIHQYAFEAIVAFYFGSK